MKTKIILAAAMVCFLGFQTANADIKKSTDNWTKKSDTPTLRDGNADGETATSAAIPVGDALWIAGLLAGGYAIAKLRAIRN
ncbi:hypothetical protein FACS1894176_11670 [Bacteroidia bacterium]|nr:hypothetical protein FACS1894176_11670 [Bacteroidia bacterium]